LFQPCPVGYIRATTGATDFKPIGTADVPATDCIKCAATFACTVPGASALAPMKLKSTDAANNVGLCGAGFFCKEGATETNPLNECDPAVATCNMGICPEGYYCPRGTNMPVVCPTGKFSNSIGVRASSECLDCFEGYYCGGSTTKA